MALDPATIDEHAVWESIPRLPNKAGEGQHHESLSEDQLADIAKFRTHTTDKGQGDDSLVWDIATGLVSGTRAGAAGIIGGGGEAVHQLYQHATGDPNAPQTMTEAGKRIGTAAMTSAVGTKVGEKLAKGTQALTKRFMEKPRVPGAEEAVQDTTAGLPYRGTSMAASNPLPLTPAQQTEHHMYTILENVAKGASFGGGRMEQFEQAGQAYTKGAVEKFVNELGGVLSPSELGLLTGKTIAGERQAVLAPLKAEYNQFDKVLEARSVKRMVLVKGEDGKMVPVPKTVLDPATGAVINTKPMKNWAKQMLNPQRHNQGAGSTTVLNKILALPDEISYTAAKELRTNLYDMSYQSYLASNGKDAAVGMAKKAARLVRDARQRAVEKFDPRSAAQLADLDKRWGEGAGRVDNDYLRKLIDTALDKNKGLPENIKADIVTPQGVSHLKRVKVAIGQTPTWGKLQAATLQGEMEKATDPATKVLNFKTLEKRLFGRSIDSYETGLGKEVTDTLYSPEQLAWMKKVLNVGLQQQKKPVTEVGRMAIQMKTAGAVMAIGAAVGGAGEAISSGDMSGVMGGAGMGAATGAGAVLLTPVVLARLMTKPDLAQYLVKGMTTPFNSPKAVPVIARLLAVTGLAMTKPAMTLQHPQPPMLQQGHP